MKIKWSTQFLEGRDKLQPYLSLIRPAEQAGIPCEHLAIGKWFSEARIALKEWSKKFEDCWSCFYSYLKFAGHIEVRLD